MSVTECHWLTHRISCDYCVTRNTRISASRQVNSGHSEFICCAFENVLHCILSLCKKTETQQKIEKKKNTWVVESLDPTACSVVNTCYGSFLIHKAPVIGPFLVSFQVVSNYFGSTSIRWGRPWQIYTVFKGTDHFGCCWRPRITCRKTQDTSFVLVCSFSFLQQTLWCLFKTEGKIASVLVVWKTHWSERTTYVTLRLKCLLFEGTRWCLLRFSLLSGSSISVQGPRLNLWSVCCYQGPRRALTIYCAQLAAAL